MTVYLPSLKSWIQSTALLVFFSGYVSLFASFQSILSSESVEMHEHLIARIRQGLSRGDIELPFKSPVGTRAELVESGNVFAPSIFIDDERRIWMRSASPYPRTNSDSVLFVSQDISEMSHHHENLFRAMLFIASISVLVSALLLRLVLWRGMSLPLSVLSREMDELEADSLGSKLIDSNLHPYEFKPIVNALNQLQLRLSLSWQRERLFVDGVAHELRTPITVLSSCSQRLLSDIADEAKPTAKLLVSESQRLGDLLAVMLDFSRVDAGRLALSLDLFDPELLCIEAFERLQYLSPHRIQLRGPVEQASPKIMIDEQRFHQCMSALVENALRYSSGIVEISVSITSGHIIFHVIDSGPGIPEDERDVVVARFVRGSTSIGTRGSGMGLALVDQLMSLMGGRLVIGDSPDQGADVQLLFTF